MRTILLDSAGHPLVLREDELEESYVVRSGTPLDTEQPLIASPHQDILDPLGRPWIQRYPGYWVPKIERVHEPVLRAERLKSRSQRRGEEALRRLAGDTDAEEDKNFASLVDRNVRVLIDGFRRRPVLCARWKK